MKTLNRQNSNLDTVSPERIMQFGGGNFLRAFTDWMIDILNDSTDFSGSVVIVKPTERGDYSDLDAQDGLYHLALDGVQNGQVLSDVVMVKSVSRTIQPYTQWDDFMELATSEDLRFIISNTTEAGIQFSSKDKLTDQPPHEFPGKLTQWLYARFKYFNGNSEKGCIILPCELIENNGDALHDVVLQYADSWELGEDFVQWVNESNYFYNTLVDRIVSGFPSKRGVQLLERVGYKDKMLVAGEFYHNWTIQGHPIIQSELPFDKTDLNVHFVDNLADYRELKVRILNGAHTSLVPVGYLAGVRTVKEAMSHEYLEKFVLNVLQQEVKPTLVNISEAEKQSFINSVIDRFKNPTLEHKLMDISLNSFSKFKARLLPAFTDYVASNNTFPKGIAFALTSMILFYKGSFQDEAIELRDDAQNLAFAFNVWTEYDEDQYELRQVIERFLIELDVMKVPGLDGKSLLDFMEKIALGILADGVEATLKASL
ncbi:tagaturonate reductase [Membranihabitans marinus]|uniref:tagaturonate reductase n=1 Tax=Membranihabitans marinus TaxID=1227546 RepID=UPI001F189B6F|nr:tagaturonate reductase [Membranihabitans marinus]